MIARPLLAVGLLPFALSAAPAPNPAPGPAPGPDEPPALVADGVADDTAALQALADAGGRVELPAGPLRITAPIVIDLQTTGRTAISGGGAARVIMAGAGPAFRFVGTHHDTAHPWNFDDQVWAKENAPALDGVEIVGAHPEADGVEVEGTMQFTLTRLVVRQARHAVRLTKNNRNVAISDCHFYENRGVGIFMDGVNIHQVNVSNCHLSYNAGGGIVARDSELRNLHVSACDLEQNVGPADRPTGPRGAPANVWLDSTNGSVAEVAIVGCTLQHGSVVPGSANIRVEGFSEPDRWAEERRHGQILISGNILSDVGYNIDLKNVRGGSVVGNTFWRGFESNLRAEGCSHLVVANNVWDNSDRYHYGEGDQDGANAKLGVQFLNCTDCTITGNHSSGYVLNDAALIVRDCDRMHVADNTILDYGQAGLLLDGVTNSLIAGNLIRDDRPDTVGAPLRTERLKGVQFTGNLIGRDIGDAVKFED